ncbi:MAG: hypothetical protein DWQ47_00325 [Acidobacteria bacterium]|nr:MAG: hypothetical protein DWQ32_10785 [Acidobacteriota bacterium]REK03957.1 MAG: hypothetical protein DWQ38_00310 [Acidobacteriota bacterium]REK15119.1 MAG: hypothetical protein DWQ43_16475 [Acidobacteriota bacterium]REK46209.1 MAG: hypothetical protein DWQ47_00325 [Acidobacteriota bacterium]
MPRITNTDRIVGCLLAGALGDAKGSPFEGKKDSETVIVPKVLRTSDDTQLTLATCESIVESSEISPESIAAKFAEWFLDRRLHGLGSSTLKALVELAAGGHWATAGASGERAAGNGAAMRIAPLAFCLDPGNEEDRRKIRDVCRITHRNEEAYVGALAMVWATRFAFEDGGLTENLISELIEVLPDSRVRDRFIEVKTSSITLKEYGDRFGTSGYVVDSVPMAILVAISSEGLNETFEQIAFLGGDTDTISSMFGQIYGAANGLECLPLEDFDRIDDSVHIRAAAEDFSRTVCQLQMTNNIETNRPM